MVSLNLVSNSSSRDTVSGRRAAQEAHNINTATVFEHAYRHLVDYRNICQVYYVRAYERQNSEIDAWANDFLTTLWAATTSKDPGWSRSHSRTLQVPAD